jgi:hypothetical protein
MEHGASSSDARLALLQVFEHQYHVKVKLISFPWSAGWAEISRSGLYGHGPAPSEVGTTWVGSLASMQALRPFNPMEVRAADGKDAISEGN